MKYTKCTCTIVVMCGSSSSIWLGELDCHRADTAAVGGLLGGVGEEGFKMAKASLQYSHSHYSLKTGSVRSRLLVRKLGFLKRTVRDGATGVGAAAMRSMVDDVAFLCLVKQCKELEEGFGSQFTDKILGGDADQINMKEVKEVIE